jgi:hypothetical protein
MAALNNILPRLAIVFESSGLFCFLQTPSFDIVQRQIHCQLNWAILLCDVIPDGKSE